MNASCEKGCHINVDRNDQWWFLNETWRASYAMIFTKNKLLIIKFSSSILLLSFGLNPLAGL